MLDMGWPADLTWYRLLTDWGGVIGGGFALIAGVAAYLAGRAQARATQSAADVQAKATRQSANEQVEATQRAAEQQVTTASAALEDLRAERAEQDRRVREELLAALDVEAAKIPMLVQLLCEFARRRHTTTSNPVVTQPELYKLPVGHVLTEGRGIPTLVHANIRLAVIDLLASIEQLNALIDTKGRLMNELQGHELIEALLKVQNRANELQRALAQYGGDRRIR
jgi:multidrug efflux pump subunit AcrA (membrane-fusion protein)